MSVFGSQFYLGNGLLNRFFLLATAILLLSVAVVDAQVLLPCDLNGDDRCTPEDVNFLATSIANGVLDSDLNQDARVDTADLEFFLKNAVNRLNGDFDFFNGGVTFASFLRLSANFGQEGAWTDGDMTADGRIDFADFLLLSSSFGQTNPSLSATIEVEVSEVNGFYTYEYTVTNSSDSMARINTLFIDTVNGTDVVEGTPLGSDETLLDAPAGWIGDYRADADPVEEVNFLQIDDGFCGAMGIAAGSSETFTIESEYGPGMRNAFAATLVSSCDHFFVGANYEVLAPTVAPVSGEATSVPEPATHALILAALLVISNVRHRQV